MFTEATGLAVKIPVGASFDTTSQAIPMGSLSSGALPILTIGFDSALLGVSTPAASDADTYDQMIFTPPFWAIFATSNRVFAMFGQNTSVNSSPSVIIQQDDYFEYSDPPGSADSTSVTVVEGGTLISYTLEDSSGFGAWGSVSTGELVLIRRGQGAVIVYGDAAFPSSVIKLPAVQGTGQIMQKMTMCPAGAIYVTEDVGVWAWNGGNTSTKVSNQIPDQACVRLELQYGGVLTLGVTGCRSWHDCINGLVFLPNNWVFDSINNSWWMCEDPGIMSFGAWAKSKSNSRFMFGIEGQSSSAVSYQGVTFDTTTLASSYEWTSNPIPSVARDLSTITEVELVASNPSASACAVTVTPTIPANQVSSFVNNPQSALFVIPPFTSGYRATIELGYTEYNICINVQAANDADNPAPVVHAINLTFTTDQSAGIGQ
jgi:hypothetical protein